MTDSIARTAVIALGGNALSPPGVRSTIADQFRHTRESLGPIVDLAAEGWNLCVVYGNGPQVGDELVRNEVARADLAPLPLGVLVASTAGWIGYMVQQSIGNALRQSGLRRRVVTLITHVKKDGQGRDRRVVGSPAPLRIRELEMISQLVRDGVIVIAAGGGGIPVYRDASGALEGVDAVTDKDLSAAVLARELHAELFLILTDVDVVYADWGKPSQRALPRITVAEAESLDRAGAFGEGNMAPKVRAAVDYVRETGGRAIITELSRGLDAVHGRAGTTIAR